MRAYKTVNDAYVEPISFVVPRRSEVFQSDIYPPATGSKPGVSAADWLSGKTALPPKIDLESVYDGNAPVEVPADYKPPQSIASTSNAAKAAPAPKKEPEPAPLVAQKAPPPTMSEQRGSIAAMANKFQDNKDDIDDDADETSSFEEIAKPVMRSTPAAPKQESKTTSPVTSRATTSPVSQATPKSTEPPTSPQPTTILTSSGPITAVGSSSNSNGSVEASLAQITKLLEQQNKTLVAQSEKIGSLTAEVDSLKMKVAGGNQDQSKRIRQLELELEAARS
jgi:coronin-1B/1C/6